MKLLPTASQTVGPFFSIGLEPLYQNAAPINSANTLKISGTVFDGDGRPIPDAVLEFWGEEEFARVPTNDDGKFSVILESTQYQDGPSAKAPAKRYEVLIFMRGLLRSVYTRIYLANADFLKNDPTLKAVPTDRMATLVAKPTKSASEYEWNIFMQGKDETVFFET